MTQTPGSPVAGGSSAGRKASKRIILVCQGSSQSGSEVWNYEAIGGFNYTDLFYYFSRVGTTQNFISCSNLQLQKFMAC